MITTRLMGGLGNQMFQYAVGRRIALDRGARLRLDLGWFEREPPRATRRRYALGDFALDRAVAKTAVRIPEPASRVHLAALRGVERLGARKGLVREGPPGFDPRVLDSPDGTHLLGFWQDERYFASVGSVLRSDFHVLGRVSDATERLLGSVRSRPSVSVHVRRADYVSNTAARKHHGLLEPEWFAQAVATVADRIPDLMAFVFSDDPPWCRSWLELGVPAVVVDGGRPVEDLLAMSACAHHVIANSSFSWWGAWLGECRGTATVVVPERWLRRSSFNPCPARWIRVPNRLEV